MDKLEKTLPRAAAAALNRALSHRRLTVGGHGQRKHRHAHNAGKVELDKRVLTRERVGGRRGEACEDIAE